jgi:UDP-N-acetylmuramate dehydrogenase
LRIENNISLKKYNTFSIDVQARQFVTVNSIEELQQALAEHQDVFLLGGGSNILLVNPIEKPVIHLNIKGIETFLINENDVIIKAGAGENWHEFVLWCIENDYGGLENLSLIPGNVGTSPIQNIGAYGVEIKDVFSELTALEIATGKLKKFNASMCHFGYRNSVFKNELKGQFVIVDVSFKLTRSNHKINTDYGAIRSILSSQTPSIKEVSDAVIAIRQSKLPDPDILANSGSFFKNPVVANDLFHEIQRTYPEMPYYPVDDFSTKIPAGWLIEKCGFKGKRFGDAGVHEHQALVLVNHGNATGNELLDLANRIQSKVNDSFGIALEMEVNIIE